MQVNEEAKDNLHDTAAEIGAASTLSSAERVGTENTGSPDHGPDLVHHQKNTLKTVSEFLVDLQSLLREVKVEAQRDRWVHGLLPVIGVLAGGIVGFAGSYYSSQNTLKFQMIQSEIMRRFDADQTQLQTAQTITSLIPDVTGKDEKTRKLAMLALSELPDKKVPARVLGLYPDEEIGLKLLRQLKSDENDSVQDGLVSLAADYAAQGRNDLAESLYKRIIATLEVAVGPNDPDVADAMGHYARCLRRMNRKTEADQLDGKIRAIYAKNATLHGQHLEPS